MALTFTKQRGERGRRALMNGFMYTCQRKSENGKSSQWMCVKNKQLSCKGRLKISYNEDRADETGAHNHMPNVAECKASMATASVKRRAEDEPHTSALHITQAVYGTADDETLAALPRGVFETFHSENPKRKSAKFTKILCRASRNTRTLHGTWWGEHFGIW